MDLKCIRKSILLSLAVLALCSCGNNLKSLKVDYDVTTIAEYKQGAQDSKIPASFSSYQVSEIAYLVGSVKALCLFDKIYLADITRENLDTLHLVEKFPEYSSIQFICKDEVDTTNILLVTDETTDYEILEGLQKYSAIQKEGYNTIYPLLPEIKKIADNSPYKSEFIKSLKELMKLG